MAKSVFLFLFLLIASNAFSQNIYPLAHKDTTTDIYLGTKISDPYQWMENPEDPRLEGWLELQKKFTNHLSNKQTDVWTLKAQIASLYRDVKVKKTDTHSPKTTANKSKYQFDLKSSRDNHSPDLVYKLRGKGNYRLLLKSKNFQLDKNDNPFVESEVVNEKDDLAAITMTHNGSDWREVYFFNLKTGEQLSDTLKYLRAGSQILWDKTNIYYDRYDRPEKGRSLLDKAKGQRLCYHQLGDSQANDKVLYLNPDTTGTNAFYYFKKKDKLFFYHFYRSRGKVYRALSIANDNPESFFLKNFLIYPNSDSIKLSIEELFGDSVILKTTWNAPNGKVLVANTNELNKLGELIPQYDIPLVSVNQLGKNKIACLYRNHGQDMALIFDLKGTLIKKIDFPEGKKVHGFYENDEEATYTDFYLSSFYAPNLSYRLSLKDLTFEPITSVSVPYDPEALETRYVTFSSKDGTEIPMYITCLKDTKLKGKNPTLLYGYGGYGITVEPDFDESKALWLLHGGILAIPNIRGGGAEGSEWAKAGRRLNKQNAIDDFIAAAEYLINEKYTNPKKLAINGGSHGGLLVGAAMTQRPALFKTVIAEAGAFDMLRFSKYTVGSVNTNIHEFGDPKDSVDFVNLLSYSPLHNIKKGVKYPNTLIITGDKDNRVPPFHSYKFLATLQEKSDPSSLYCLYVIPGAGHGGALTNDDFTDALLFKYYFLFDQLGVKLN